MRIVDGEWGDDGVPSLPPSLPCRRNTSKNPVLGCFDANHRRGVGVARTGQPSSTSPSKYNCLGRTAHPDNEARGPQGVEGEGERCQSTWKMMEPVASGTRMVCTTHSLPVSIPLIHIMLLFSQTHQVNPSGTIPKQSDPFHGQETLAKIAAGFITHLFACPDYPPTMTCSHARLPYFIAYTLHLTNLHSAALVLLHCLKAQFLSACRSSGHHLFIST